MESIFDTMIPMKRFVVLSYLILKQQGTKYYTQ